MNELTLQRSTLLTSWTKTYEHGIILPGIVGDAIFLEGCGEDFPSGIFQADFKTLEVVGTLLFTWPVTR